MIGAMQSLALLLLLLVGICQQVCGSLPAYFDEAYLDASPSGFPFYHYPGGLSLQENFPAHLPYCTPKTNFYTCNFTSTDKVIVLSHLDKFSSRKIRISDANTVLMVLPLCDFTLKFENVSKIQMGYKDLTNAGGENCDNSFTAINSRVGGLIYQVSNVELNDTQVNTMSSGNEINLFLASRSTFAHIKSFLTSSSRRPSYFYQSSVRRISNMVIKNALVFMETRIDLIGPPGITLKSQSSLSFWNLTIGTLAKTSLFAENASIHLQNVIIERAEEHAFSILMGSILIMKNVTIRQCDNCIRHHSDAHFILQNFTVNARSVGYVHGRVVVLPNNESVPESVSLTEDALIVSDLEHNLVKYTISGMNHTKLVCSHKGNSAEASNQKPCSFESFVVANGSNVKTVVEINARINVTVDSSRVDGITATAPISLKLVNATVGDIFNVKLARKSYIGEGSTIQHIANTSAFALFVNRSFVEQIDDMVVEGSVHFDHSKVKRIMSIGVGPNASLLLEDVVVDFFAPKCIYLAENATLTILGNPPRLPSWPFVSAESYDQVRIEKFSTRGGWLPSLVRLRLKLSESPVTFIEDSRYHCITKWDNFFNGTIHFCGLVTQEESANVSTFKGSSRLQLAKHGYANTVMIEDVATLLIPEGFTASQLSLTNVSIQEFKCQAHVLVMRDVSCDVFQPRLAVHSVEVSNSTIVKVDVEMIHGNVTSSKIDHIFKMEFQDEFVFSHSHVGTIQKFGIFVNPLTTLTFENTTIDEIEKHGIVVEGTLVLTNVVIKNLEENSIVLGSSGEKIIHFENVTIEKGHQIFFLEFQRSFLFNNVIMNGKTVLDWNTELPFSTTSEYPLNAPAALVNRVHFTSEGFPMPEDIQEELMQQNGALVGKASSKPPLTIPRSVLKSRQPIKESNTTLYTMGVIIVVVLGSAFIVLLAVVLTLRQRMAAKLEAAASTQRAIDSVPGVVPSSQQAMFETAPTVTAVDMAEVDLTSQEAVYGAGGRGLIERVDAMEHGYTLTPYGLPEEQQQQQLPQQLAMASGSCASTPNGSMRQCSLEDVAENEAHSSVSVWSLTGIVKYAKFK